MKLKDIGLASFAVIAIVGLAFLSGCQDQLRANLVKTCSALADAYAHYDAVVEAGAVSERTKARVAFVRRQTDDLCTSPETATTLTITATAARAYVALNAAFKEGGELSDARVGYVKVQNLKKFLEEFKE